MSITHALVASNPQSPRVNHTNWNADHVITDIPVILSKTTGINAKNTGTTDLYTVPVGKTAYILGAVVRVTAASAISVVPTLGIGRNANQDDIFASTTLTGLNATTTVYVFTSIGIITAAAAAEIIKVGIDTGATATTMTISIDLIGYIL